MGFQNDQNGFWIITKMSGSQKKNRTLQKKKKKTFFCEMTSSFGKWQYKIDPIMKLMVKRVERSIC